MKLSALALFAASSTCSSLQPFRPYLILYLTEPENRTGFWDTIAIWGRKKRPGEKRRGRGERSSHWLGGNSTMIQLREITFYFERTIFLLWHFQPLRFLAQIDFHKCGNLLDRRSNATYIKIPWWMFYREKAFFLRVNINNDVQLQQLWIKQNVTSVINR